MAVVFTWHSEERPKTEVWPYEMVERLAQEVTDQEVFDELARRFEAMLR